MVAMKRFEIVLGLQGLSNQKLSVLIHNRMKRSGQVKHIQKTVGHMRKFVETGLWEVLQEFNNHSRYRHTLKPALFNIGVCFCEYISFVFVR